MDIVTMPQLGETVTEGTITEWSVAIGDRVEVDDALFEVSTEKVDTEVPSATAGYLRAILVPAGDTVEIGVPVAVLTETADEDFDVSAVPGASAERADDSARLEDSARFDRRSASSAGSPSRGGSARPQGGSPSRQPGSLSQRGASRATVEGSAAGSAGRDVGFVSPVVGRLLAETGVDPASVVGTGRDGRITRADVLAAAAQDQATASTTPGHANNQGVSGPAGHGASPSASTPPTAAPMEVGERDDVVDFSKARLATAEHMSRSLATAAHALVAVEVDYSNVDTVRRDAKLSYLPFVARAVIDALADHNQLNSSVDGDRLIVHRDVNLGVAVDVEQEALMVPVLKEANGLRLRAIADGVADLADRARRRRLPGDAFSGGTFTLTNVGSYGTFVTAPIINQPQVAILSTDGVRMAPVAVRTDSGEAGAEKQWGIAVHPIGNLCLSFDHRAVDGAYAASFMARVREILQTRNWAEEVSA